MHRLIPLENARDWSAALEGIPHAIAHTWGYCEAIQHSSQLPTFLYEYAGAGGRVLFPVSIRQFAERRDIVTPLGFAGPVGTANGVEFASEWTRFVQEAGFVCGYIGLHPVLDCGVFTTNVYSSNCVYVVDLSPPDDAIFHRLSRNRKREIRAMDGKVELVFDRDRVGQFLADNIDDFLSSRGARAIYFFNRGTIERLISLRHVDLLGAAVDGRLEAAGVFGFTDTIADYLYNVSTPRGTPLSTFLTWHGILRMKERGIAKLSLGGGISAGDGVAAYKTRFGATPYPIKAAHQVYDEPVYKDLCKRRQNRGQVIAGFFPLYQSPVDVR